MGHSSFPIPDHKRRRYDQDDGSNAPAQIRTGGVVLPLGLCRSTSPGLHG